MAEIKAQLNYLHIAPRKVRLVANLVKGMSVAEARLELESLPKRSAGPMLKLLQSAVANAKHNFQIGEKGFYLKKVVVNPGPVSKRFEPRAFGRAAPVRMRTSHILLVLDTKEEVRHKPLKHGADKQGPVVREITAEDIKEESEVRSTKTAKRPDDISPIKNVPGFVKRVFRRKVI